MYFFPDNPLHNIEFQQEVLLARIHVIQHVYHVAVGKNVKINACPPHIKGDFPCRNQH